jgi:hypothetical protein
VKEVRALFDVVVAGAAEWGAGTARTRTTIVDAIIKNATNTVFTTRSFIIIVFVRSNKMSLITRYNNGQQRVQPTASGLPMKIFETLRLDRQ